MTLNHLAVFHAVAQTGNMTLGAERLDISQPAVSKQVQELERALGVHLFDRIGRRVRLSQAGEVLADYARRLFALAQEAGQAMADLRAVAGGKLVIGASTTIGTYLLPGVVAEFWRRHPGVELLVEIENTEQVHRRLTGPSPWLTVSGLWTNSMVRIHLTILKPSWFSTRSRSGAPCSSPSGS